MTQISRKDASALQGLFDEYLFHGTSERRLNAIIRKGLACSNGMTEDEWGNTEELEACSFWGSPRVAVDYALDTASIRDEGWSTSPVLIVVKKSDLLELGDFRIDRNTLDWPLDVYSRGVGALGAMWEDSCKTAEDCLEIYESVILDVPVPSCEIKRIATFLRTPEDVRSFLREKTAELDFDESQCSAGGLGVRF